MQQFIRPTEFPLTLAYMSVTDPNVLETADGLKYFAPEREAAWIGLLQAHSELTRGLDAALSARHGLSFSSYEVLSRIAHAEGGQLRMSVLAERSQLSLSRVSRVIDALEQRGLVARRSCATDSRVVHATITDAGRALVAEAQETFFEVVEERFLARLTCDEVGQLGSLLARLVQAPLGSACPGAQEAAGAGSGA
jgi:DNA-binding MarR family transcriptional regulator